VVEGYFDAVRLMSSGIEEVVAPLGTALTEAQAGMLRKYSRNVFLLYDSDAAGLKATFRAGDELLSQGFAVRVVTLPPGEDPDTFVRDHGAEGLESEISKSIDVFERKIQILERAGWFGELQKKRRALDRLLPTIRATSDEIMRDLYIGRASEVTGVNREILLRELGVRAPAQQSAPIEIEARPQRPAIRSRTIDRRVTRRSAGTSAERELVRAMLHTRSQVEAIAERIGPDAFKHPVYRKIFSALLEHGEEASLDELANDLDADALDEAQEMLSESRENIDMQRTIDDSITQLHVIEMEHRLSEIDDLIPIASETEKETLQKEKQQLVMQMRASGKQRFGAVRRWRTR
jgi:DNA primase